VSLSKPLDRSGLLWRIAAGLLAFAAGAALALSLLPEWSPADLRSERFFAARYLQVAVRAGFQPAPGEPLIFLTGSGQRAPLLVEVRGRVRYSRDPGEQTLAISFSPAGKPLVVHWQDFGASLFRSMDSGRYDRLSLEILSMLLAPGESAGTVYQKPGLQYNILKSFEIVGTSPPEHLRLAVSPPYVIEVRRAPGEAAADLESGKTDLLTSFLVLLAYLSLLLAVVVVFLALLVRSQIDLTNGAILALATLLSANLGEVLRFRLESWISYASFGVSAFGLALWVFLVWSAGESLLRALRPDFTTSLDTLRLGRLGPRGGRSLLLGFGYGAALAGLVLALHALAGLAPGFSLNGPSLELPIFSLDTSPLGSGISAAAIAALAFALALRFLPERWTVPAAALLAGLVSSPFQIDPFAARLVAATAFMAVLVRTARRHGLTALLVASVTSFLLPAALFSALHLSWLPGSFALTLGLSALLLSFGFVGISRSEEEESGSLPTPAFMRRLKEERRIRHEVDLLARMQEGLLPGEMPRLPGYEIAARSVLASEAGGDLYDFLSDESGRFWIAAGDVAGHGYSCAVAQAMVKAGLLSLVEPEETPAGVLRRLDQVLRSVSTDHSFTSLALIRLDPATGEAELANAGHPYPLLAEFGRVTEIELPGLPLGRGPSFPYKELPFRFPPGAALVLCSDGLFEALDRNGNAYGFERAREVLKAMGHRPALEIVDALLNDLRRHLGTERAPDDVTVVVVKRG